VKEIARFYDPEEAKIAAGFLRAEGFDVTLPEEHTLAVQPELRFTLGGFRLLAPTEQAFLATKMLESVKRGGSGPACPECGGRRVLRDRKRPFLMNLLALFSLGLAFTPATSMKRCPDCGATWKEDDADEPEHEL
jgi:DNA-directed RNA polymerase subunit RPC12/RpoP